TTKRIVLSFVTNTPNRTIEKHIMLKTAIPFVFIALTLFAAVCHTSATKQSTTNSNSEEYHIDSLLDLVQQQTFQSFWEGAEPNSGLARERIHLDGDYPQNDHNVITIGGIGFGLMAILVGIHNEYITREEGAERIGRALAFLDSVDRFQGAWSHWYHGDTGKPK